MQLLVAAAPFCVLAPGAGQMAASKLLSEFHSEALCPYEGAIKILDCRLRVSH